MRKWLQDLTVAEWGILVLMALVLAVTIPNLIKNGWQRPPLHIIIDKDNSK